MGVGCGQRLVDPQRGRIDVFSRVGDRAARSRRGRPDRADAKDLIRGMDIATLDTTAIEAEVREDWANATGPDGELSPMTGSDAEVKRDAVSRIVAQTVFNGLLERGHVMSVGHEVSIAMQSTVCD